MIAALRLLSDRVVEILAEAEWPVLRPSPNGTTGQIFLIDAHRVDQFMPPRILAIPVASKFGGPNATRGPVTVAANASGYDSGSRAAINNRPIATERVIFEIRCWGIASDTGDTPSDSDFECTRALYHAIFNAANGIAGGCFEFGDGQWATVAHLKRVGREFIFMLTIDTPITSRLQTPAAAGVDARPLPNAPADVAMVATDAMVIGTGDSGAGCEE